MPHHRERKLRAHAWNGVPCPPGSLALEGGGGGSPNVLDLDSRLVIHDKLSEPVDRVTVAANLCAEAVAIVGRRVDAGALRGHVRLAEHDAAHQRVQRVARVQFGCGVQLIVQGVHDTMLLGSLPAPPLLVDRQVL